MTINEMLEQRHTLKLVWHEPWAATSPQGTEIDAHVELRATVHDCVNLARNNGKVMNKPTVGQDAEWLINFMAVHFAEPENKSTSTPCK